MRSINLVLIRSETGYRLSWQVWGSAVGSIGSRGAARLRACINNLRVKQADGQREKGLCLLHSLSHTHTRIYTQSMGLYLYFE